MKRYTLPVVVLLAASILALAALGGCGSSTSTTNTPANKAEIIRANSVVMSTVADVVNNDAFLMLNNPAFTRLLNLGGAFIPQMLRSANDPRSALEAVRTLHSRRASKPNSQLTLPTGTYRVDANDSLVYSPIPSTYLRLIMANQTTPADSDSITLKGVSYGSLATGSGTEITLDTIPVAATIRMYTQHPSMGSSAGLIATVTYALSTTAAHQLSQVVLGMNMPSVMATTITLTLDSVHYIYSLRLDINAIRQGVQESVLLAMRTSGNILTDSEATLTEVDFNGSHTYAGNSWANNLAVTNIFLDPSSSGNDSAHVAGDIRKNNVIAATIVGTLKTPAEGDSCPPINVTVTATGETGSICEFYGELSIPSITLRPRALTAALNNHRVTGIRSWRR